MRERGKRGEIEGVGEIEERAERRRKRAEGGR